MTLIEPPVFVPETMEAFRVLELFRQAGTPVAIVVDEFGGTQGIVTPSDILAAIVGALPSPEHGAPQPIARVDERSWSVDGTLVVDDLRDLLDLSGAPDDERGSYRTVGGLVMTRLGRVPAIGDTVEWAGLRVEVLDMEGRRIDRVLIHVLDDDGVESEDGVTDR
jgi:putative hemolysin